MKTLWKIAAFLCLATPALAQVQLGPGVQVGGAGSGSGATLPTNAIVYGTSPTTSRAVTGSDIANVEQSRSGCLVAGNLWEPYSGTCVTPASSGLTGQTTSCAPKANSSTTANGPMPVCDDGTTTTITHGVHINAPGPSGITFTYNGTPVVPVSGSAAIGSDSSGNGVLSENGAALSRLCTVLNGLCGGSAPAFSAITGGTNTGAAMLVGTGASLAPTGSGTITPSAVNLAGTGNGGVTGTLPVSHGGTGTTTPGIVAGTNVTVTGTWPNQTVNSTGGGSNLPALVAQPSPSSTTILQAVTNAANQVVSVAVFGDSFTKCDQTNCGAGGGPVTSTNRWPERIRIQGQAIYGSHGTGLVPIIFASATSPSPVDPEAYSTTGTYDTSTSSLGPTQGGGNTIVHLATGATITFNDSRAIAWDTLHVYGATSAGSGSLACTATPGGSLGTLTTGSASASGAVNGGFTARRWDLSAIALTTHSVTCTATGDFYLFGFQGTAGTTGFEVHNLGIGGATVGMFGASAANQLTFSDLIPAGTQAALMMDQTNDAAGGVSTATFQTNLQNWITHEQALTSAPTVILAIPPVDVVNGTFAMAPYTAIQTGLCTSAGIPCINIQTRGTTVGSTSVGWGTAYNATSGLWDLTGSAWPGGNAGVHPNDKGGLDQAQQIYALLVNPTSSSGGGSDCTNNCAFTGSTTFTNSSGGTAATFSSTSTAGTAILIQGSASGIHNWGIQSGLGTGPVGGDAQFLVGDFTSGIYGWAEKVTGTGSGYNAFPALSVLGWSSVGSVTDHAIDTGLSRDSAGVVDVGNGTQGDASGTLKAAKVLGGNGLEMGIPTWAGGYNLLNFNGVNSAAGSVGFTGGTGDPNLYSNVPTGGGYFKYINNVQVASLTATGYSQIAGKVYGWANDTGLSRDSAGVVDVGNGTAGNASGTIKAATYASGTLANGMIATTQSASDNSTKVATTAYFDRNFGVGTIAISGVGGIAAGTCTGYQTLTVPGASASSTFTGSFVTGSPSDLTTLTGLVIKAGWDGTTTEFQVCNVINSASSVAGYQVNIMRFN